MNFPNTDWRKPSSCASSGCVEVLTMPNGVRFVRDNLGQQCIYDEAEWSTFITAVKAGEFD